MVDKDILGSAVRTTPGATVPRARRTVGQLMRPPTATIEPAAHLAAAAYLIKHLRTSVLVVTTGDDHGHVAMISDEDIAHAITRGLDPERTRVRQVVGQQQVSVASHAAAADAARLALARGREHLLVVDGEQLVGTVDLDDLCEAVRAVCDGREKPKRDQR